LPDIRLVVEKLGSKKITKIKKIFVFKGKRKWYNRIRIKIRNVLTKFLFTKKY